MDPAATPALQRQHSLSTPIIYPIRHRAAAHAKEPGDARVPRPVWGTIGGPVLAAQGSMAESAVEQRGATCAMGFANGRGQRACEAPWRTLLYDGGTHGYAGAGPV